AAQEDKVILLTTHSMEEAEALSSRIIILVDGEIRCQGSATDLKAQYSTGVTLNIVAKSSEVAEEEDALAAFVKDLCPPIKMISRVFGNYEFRVPSSAGVSVAQLYRALLAAPQELGVKDVGLSSTSLFEVFLSASEPSGDAAPAAVPTPEEPVMITRAQTLAPPSRPTTQREEGSVSTDLESIA
ncbi:ABC transporter A, ABCA, partial [Kipferlia bialata]